METKVWIIGSSSGIGLELVKLCLQSNHKVIASSRNAKKSEELLQLKSTYTNKLELLDIDVSSKVKISVFDTINFNSEIRSAELRDKQIPSYENKFYKFK